MSAFTLRLRIYITIFAVVLVTGMLGMMAIEGFSALDSVYFLIVTIATVGFGDLHPSTPAGKILVIFIILCGVGCFIGLVANAIEHIIEQRERASRKEKINMIIGVFYSEVGTNLLKTFSAKDPGIGEMRSALLVSNGWSEENFIKAQSQLGHHVYNLDSRNFRLEDLHGFLTRHKGFMLALLENPYLFEDDKFTDLLYAVFHLAEELIARAKFTNLPPADHDHLSGDITRVYRQLVTGWLDYMHHLKNQYPYLFSLAMRTNPFDENAGPVVMG